MFLLKHDSFKVSEETYEIKLENGKIIQYKEWSDESGKIIDTAIKDKKGKEIDDISLLQKIWNLVDKNHQLA
jgi:hypothetical protein